jgi:hypothetical protein
MYPISRIYNNSFAFDTGDFEEKVESYDSPAGRVSHVTVYTHTLADNRRTLMQFPWYHLADCFVYPSAVVDRNWLQAPIPLNFFNRVNTISQYSAKFIIDVRIDKVDEVWEQFCTAYFENRLGYGLRISTAKIAPIMNKHTMTIHVENFCNLGMVAVVAYEIHRLLGRNHVTFCLLADIATELNQFEEKIESPLRKALFVFRPSYFDHGDNLKTNQSFVDSFIYFNASRISKIQQLLDFTISPK